MATRADTIGLPRIWSPPVSRRVFLWLFLAVLASSACRGGGARVVDTGTVETTGPLPCEADEGLTVDVAEVTQPWGANEAQFSVVLSVKAHLAIACAHDEDPTEVHLVESEAEDTAHTLRMGGLLARSTYRCSVAPVCPTTADKPTELVLETPAMSDSELPSVNVMLHDATAGRDYVALNHQVDQGGPNQRLMVLDREGRVRWHGTGVDTGNSLSFQEQSGQFTLAGGWFPGGAWAGRPVQIGRFGAQVEYDVAPLVPDPATSWFHHDGRELPDGRFLTLEETPMPNGNGGSIDGIRTRILNPVTKQIDFEWTSQAEMESGVLTRGGNEGDIYHANWIDLQEVGGQEVIYLSLCFPSQVVAVNVATGTVRWTFGPEGDFTLLDAAGNGLGREGYSHCQHGLQIRGDRLLVYDNGRPPRPWSRATEYQLNEATMQATLLWEYTEPDWFEQSLGGVDWTQADRVMIGMGHGESFSQTPGDRTTLVEIDPRTGVKLWEARFGDVRDLTYKVDAIAPCRIFGNAKHCRVVERRLETLSALF